MVLRYFGAFSARSCNNWSGGHIPIFLDRILNDLPVDIHGDGSQTRSMAYIDDLIDGTILAMENENAVGQIINIGNDEEISVLDSAVIIHRIATTGHDLKINFVPMAQVFGNYKDIQRRKPDLSKAYRLLGYRPSISFEEGIEKMVSARRRQAQKNQNVVALEERIQGRQEAPANASEDTFRSTGQAQ